MKPLPLRRLGNILIASKIAYKKISRLTSGQARDGFFPKREEHLEEPGQVWFLDEKNRGNEHQAIPLK